ncbi:ATP-dependent DNA ligase [Vibrio sp. MACH09]|uniref:DNA ligase n=1 Tax=Vibrio sp. MACH09 TaxID=3025122 RepID=UPI00278F71CF|nr:DNA ligase [Vibrio sp. MACH09]GLO60877.1 ATP-dependent DNA ligase [Vibrio sp. MACH09]
MSRVIKLSMIAITVQIAFGVIPTDASTNFEAKLAQANEYQNHQHIEGYWFSEKLDGIRAVWTGSQLLTRKGNKIIAPAWFTNMLPNYVLEGELWAGRGEFQLVQTTVLKSIPVDAGWKHIRFMLFDTPNSSLSYRQRYAWLQKLVIDLAVAHIDVVEQRPVKSKEQVENELLQLTSNHAEGIILRDPKASYAKGRSNTLLKLKKHQDAEAVVIGYKAGKGKYLGQTGALLVQNGDGVQFYIGAGLTDKQRKQPPVVGEIITYQFNGFTHTGIPRFARLLRVKQ